MATVRLRFVTACVLVGGRACAGVRPPLHGRATALRWPCARASAADNRKARRDKKPPSFGKGAASFLHENCGKMVFKMSQKISLSTASDLSSGKSGTCKR